MNVWNNLCQLQFCIFYWYFWCSNWAVSNWKMSFLKFQNIWSKLQWFDQCISLYWLIIGITLNLIKASYNWIAFKKGIAKTRKRITFCKQSFDNILLSRDLWNICKTCFLFAACLSVMHHFPGMVHHLIIIFVKDV